MRIKTRETKKDSKIKFLSTLCILLYLFIFTQILLYKIEIPIFLKTLSSILFNIPALLTFIYLFFILKNKGYLPNTVDSSFLAQHLRYFKKFCNRCQMYRPERSHHCSKCNRCIKKMDHHCIWLGVCINNDNMGHFVRFIFFGFWSSFILFATQMSFLLMNRDKNFYKKNVVLAVFIITTTLVTAITSIITFLFFKTAFRNVMKNVTFLEKEKYVDYQMFTNNEVTNPYDRGVWKNIRDVLGDPRSLFLFGRDSDGIFFEKTYECDMWPPSCKEISRRREIQYL
ncbi:hypothetical protein EDEG_00850 [Edhazardia aedis USNM 41457]|uniref:Palmitoyltransferase n=1 Tax=Edhazardia aedis (strain USNM 41457) TaxID=1003232 RepID=J9DC73_EDHAE|nr:hypothetical protein EDEG_00850 [Edhazardia aedis USNM 41457]|eukprot:EJW05069.1 hypothetical protein EDEG_00850 [Edhazardia aedis USNM 41457]